jgi:hypothetical protein
MFGAFKKTLVVLAVLGLMAGSAFAAEGEHAEHHAADTAAHSGGHDEGHEGGHHGGLHVEIGGGLASGYERYGVIATNETARTGFAGVGYSFSNGFHAGVHGMIGSTSKEQFEREVAPHIGWHGGNLSVSAAYNDVEHTNHKVTTKEVELKAGYGVTEHLTLDLLLNGEVDREKRSYYGAGGSYKRKLGDDFGFRFNAMAHYLSTSGIIAHESATAAGEGATALTEGAAGEGGGATASTSFSGLQNYSVGVALDYAPAALHGLMVTGFARAVNPLSDDGKKNMEARSFDAKTSSISMAGIEVKFGF